MIVPEQVADRERAPDLARMERGRPLAVVIVTYNSSSVLGGLLDSLPAGLKGIESYEVVVVDNASMDQSVAIALAHPIGVRVIRMGRNAGYSAGINAATATIEPHKNVLILNPDVRLHPGAGRIMNERLNDPSVGVVAPRMFHEDGSLCLSLRREPSLGTAWTDALVGSKLAALMGLSETVTDRELYAKGGAVEWAVGAVLAIGARTRQVVGDWDETFFLYSEEVDYQERVRRSGLSVLYDTEASVMHIGGKFQDNPWLCSLMSANRIRYFGRRHGPLATMLFRLSVIVGESMRFPLGQRHRAALRAAFTA
jgi:GT2 family glycosyltransferase